MDDAVTRYQAVLADIANHARQWGRPLEAITVIAVSKTHPVEAIRPLLLAGHRHFGENRVQEALAKWPALKEEFPDICLHLIGPLQRNKLKQAWDLFDVIHTLDRVNLIDAMAAQAKQTGHCPKLLLQVNSGHEPQKAGVAPDQIAATLSYAKEQGLAVAGLMAIPPVDQDPSLHFGLLQQAARLAGLAELSMGMSADYPQAIALGATMIRLGTAFFGHRPALALANP